MGIRASLTLVPSDVFAALQADPNANTPDLSETFDLGKAWFNFHLVFRGEPGPLRYIVQGDIAERLLDRNLVLEEDQAEDDGDGAHFGYISPATVRTIADILKSFPLWKVIDRLRKENPLWVRHKQSRDRLSNAFDQLVQAYVAAAAQGAALQVLIC
jgi:hypothetical protein